MKRIAICLALLSALCCTAFAEPLAYDDPSLWAWWAEGEQSVDLFLICPTVDMGRAGNLNMDVNDETMRGNFMAALMQERGLYDGACTLYAPYYRQATFPAYEGADGAAEAFDLAYADIRAAFLHYLSQSDRPFILAGFSQGAQMSLELMKDLFEDDALRARLVAAYLIGWRVTEDDLKDAPWIAMARGEDDAGSVICFEVESPDTEESLIVPKDCRTYSINPLNWRTDGTPADKSLNKGACFTNAQGGIDHEIPELTGAYIDEARGTLKATDVSPEDYPGVIFPDGIYHLYDFFFFFRNLQDNVRVRIDAYMNGAIQAAA